MTNTIHLLQNVRAASRDQVTRVALVLVGSVVALVASNQAVTAVCTSVVAFDCPRAWPVSVGGPRVPSPSHALAAGLTLAAFALLADLLIRARYSVGRVIPAALILMVLATLVQGVWGGFVQPIAGTSGGAIQYFHDAVKVDDAGRFLASFNAVQVDLLTHSRTHPPGAVLSVYFLWKVLSHPVLIALSIGAISTVLSGLFLYGILRRHISDRWTAGYSTFLFFLVPAINVYYLASLDALVATALLGAVYFYLEPRSVGTLAGLVLSLFAASFLTFGFLFILPVLVLHEMIARRSLWPGTSAVAIALVGALYVAMYAASGFDYLLAFRTASALENPDGFMLLAHPVDYAFTRMENIAEIALFWSPFLVILTFAGLRDRRFYRAPLGQLTLLAIGTLLAMFATGAFKTGETARAAMFIYPFLLFPVAHRVSEMRTPAWKTHALLWVVFVQTVAMQLLGTYFW